MTKEELRKLAYQKKNKIIKQHNKKIRRRVIGWNILGATSLMLYGYNLLDVCKTAISLKDLYFMHILDFVLHSWDFPIIVF